MRGVSRNWLVRLPGAGRTKVLRRGLLWPTARTLAAPLPTGPERYPPRAGARNSAWSGGTERESIAGARALARLRAFATVAGHRAFGAPAVKCVMRFDYGGP